MRPLPRDELRFLSAAAGQPRFDQSLLQAGLGGCPWRIVLACMLLNRTTRSQAQYALENILSEWPTPRKLSYAPPPDVYDYVRGCGFGEQRTKTIRLFSFQYDALDTWNDLSELRGVGPYALDCVALVLYGDRPTCGDRALEQYATAPAGR